MYKKRGNCFEFNRKSSRTTVALPHPVPLGLLNVYLEKSVPYRSAIVSVDVKFIALTDPEFDALHDACMEECFPRSHAKASPDNRVLDLDKFKIEMKA